MIYKATLDQTSKIITGVLTLSFLGVTAYNIYLIYEENGDLTHFGATIFATSMGLLIFLLCYLYRPIQYSLDKERIIIHRPLYNLSLDLKSIREAVLLNKESMFGTKKKSGVGGLFGYYGKFKNQTYGDMIWYATKKHNYTILETVDNNKVILTPDNIDMAKELKKLIQNK